MVSIYGCFSTNMQRAASIDEQIRQCRDYASRQKGYVVVEEYVRSDQALTGAVRRRDALQSLLDEAKHQPRPFDIVLVDDTSRLARNTKDSRGSVAILKFNDVAVVTVSQGLDSRLKSARQILTLIVGCNHHVRVYPNISAESTDLLQRLRPRSRIPDAPAPEPPSASMPASGLPGISCGSGCIAVCPRI